MVYSMVVVDICIGHVQRHNITIMNIRVGGGSGIPDTL